MPNPTTGAAANLSLADLTQWLWGQESLFGPVMAIGNDGKQTAATFDRTKPRPDAEATIALLVAGAAVVPAGSTQLCQGTVFVSGQLAGVVVYR